ncbi:MAG: hypothetical protein Q7S27_01145 [Nanoarchaeota archaeon]|nr:hypothetical protein [Nanoarchaeota archaeon]
MPDEEIISSAFKVRNISKQDSKLKEESELDSKETPKKPLS